MSIVGAFAVPHPPLIIPAVGNGMERDIPETVAAYQRVAQTVARLNADVLVVATSHAPAFRDGFYVSYGQQAFASLAQFGAPAECFNVAYDEPLAQAIRTHAAAAGIPVADRAPSNASIDHAAFIPLWFLREELASPHATRAFVGEEANRTTTETNGEDSRESMPALPPLVRIGLSWLSYDTHRELGKCIAKAIAEDGRRVVFIASGDLSHKLREDGPYGFAPEGPQFDNLLVDIFRTGTLERLFGIDEAFAEAAAECGLRPFQIMAGALEGTSFTAELMSYEGPFGVGYGCASFLPSAANGDGDQDAAFCENERPSEHPSVCAASGEDARAGERENAHSSADERAASNDAAPLTSAEPKSVFPCGEDASPYVALARASVEHYVTTGEPLPLPANTPAELPNCQAGAFVSLHAHGALRGCIGTIAPCRETLAQEIIANGIAACSRDPRFDAVRPDELDFLSYSVDVLEEPEPIGSTDELDPVRYGVIVSKGWKRGLLLPNLEGITTVEEQVSYARMKAGIRPYEQGVTLERFEVTRHEAGGRARRE